MISWAKGFIPKLFSEGTHRELVSGTAVALLCRIAGAGIQFLFNVVLARHLGAGGLGIYLLALTISSITSVIGRAGLDLTLLRFVARYRAVEHRPCLKQGWARMMGLALLLSAPIVLCAFLLAPYLAEVLFNEPALTTPLRWMLLSVIPFSLLILLSESLRAIEQIAKASLVQTALLPALCLLFFWIFFSLGLDVRAAVFSYVLSTCVLFFVAFGMWQHSMSGLLRTKGRDGPTLKAILVQSVPMAWVSVTSVAMGLVDTLFIGYFCSTAEVGIYGAALRLSLLLGFVLLAVNSRLAPKIVQLYQEGDRAGLERILQFGTKLMMLMTLPVIIVFMAAPSTIIQIFGSEFRPGALSLLILAAGQLVNVSIGSVGLVLLMTGNERKMSAYNSVSAVCNIALCILLIPRYGIVGGAIANASSLAILNVLALASTLHCVGASPLPWLSIAGHSR